MKSGGKPGSMSASLGRSSPRPRPRWSQAAGPLQSARRRSQSPLSGAAAIIKSGAVVKISAGKHFKTQFQQGAPWQCKLWILKGILFVGQ